MRYIKFRAWDKRREQMYSNVLPLSDGMFLKEGINSAAVIPGGMKIDDELPKDFVIMQFTGLTDKNGTEIYEGDILRAKQVAWGYSEHLILCAWEPDNASFSFKIIQKIGGLNDGTPGVGSGWVGSVVDGLAEVIGNIHQNPDYEGAGGSLRQ